MKKATHNIIFALLTSVAMADKAPDVVVAPAPSPTLGDWFVGGTFGQVRDGDNIFSGLEDLLGVLGGFGYGSDDLEAINIGDLNFDLYTLHVGRPLPEKFMGWSSSAYLELAYLQGGLTISGYSEDLGSALGIGIDLDIIPITANLKLERQLWRNLGVYASGGLGFAFTQMDTSLLGRNISGDAIEFYAQMSFGLSYEVVENVEAFGGVRWMKLGSMDFGTSIPFELIDDQYAWEFGVRYHF